MTHRNIKDTVYEVLLWTTAVVAFVSFVVVGAAILGATWFLAKHAFMFTAGML